MGLALSAPDYSTVSRRQAHLAADLPVKPSEQPITIVPILCLLILAKQVKALEG
ncbi:MAG TPA: hypothetical protein EYG11_15920 [Candidatus Latescibacteria bacterium]|nr:hypothetical protein [Candidatus Handelsmanbacteria bacterium]HIL10186.1 hypothetical protein [Candidatus Latescibacterota bacterium]